MNREVNMKILVYGAGPLGSLFAARLHEAGHDVSVLARGQRLKELREHGIVLEDAETGEREVAHPNVVEMLGPDDEYDLVMVMMRKNHALQILPTLAANNRVPTVLFMMNNAGGQDKLVESIDKDRLMVGFPYPGGERDGYVMRVLPANEQKSWTIPVGEVDGRISSRTLKVAKTLESMRGYKVQVRTDMDAWLKYHVAGVSGLAAGMYAANTDVERFGRTPDAVVLGVRGMKESLRGLREAGIPPSPGGIRFIEWIPEPLLVWIIKKLSTTTLLKVGGEAHARAARDEMKFLMDELLVFLKKASVRTPVLDHLYQYYDPETPPIPEGSRTIQMDWRPVYAAGALTLAVALLLGLRRFKRNFTGTD
jgi:ketopantoate reductase